MPHSKALIDRKLRELVESEGCETLEELLLACIADSVSPAICMAPVRLALALSLAEISRARRNGQRELQEPRETLKQA